MTTATLTELATENAYENRWQIIKTIAQACEPLRDARVAGPIVDRLTRRERCETERTYFDLAYVVSRLAAIAPAVERDDGGARHEARLLVLLHIVLLISIARSPAEPKSPAFPGMPFNRKAVSSWTSPCSIPTRR